MNNDQPTKIVSKLYKRFTELRKELYSSKYDYKAEEQLKTELAAITRVVGAIEVMSKNSIVKLVAMQSSLRFMADHHFYMKFAETVPYLK